MCQRTSAFLEAIKYCLIQLPCSSLLKPLSKHNILYITAFSRSEFAHLGTFVEYSNRHSNLSVFWEA